MEQTLSALSRRSGIRETVLEELQALAQRHGLMQVILFGSRARGDFYPKSDIDLLISGGDAERFALDAEEQTSTLLMFDIVEKTPTTDEELLAEIERDGLVIYEKV